MARKSRVREIILEQPREIREKISNIARDDTMIDTRVDRRAFCFLDARWSLVLSPKQLTRDSNCTLIRQLSWTRRRALAELSRGVSLSRRRSGERAGGTRGF